MADDMTLKGDVIDAASAIVDPVSGESLLDAHLLEEVEVADGVATIKLAFPKDYPKDARWDLEDTVADAIEALDGVTEARIMGHIEGGAPPAAAPAAPGPAPGAGAPAAPAAGGPQKDAASPGALDGVGRVIAVASGKGGVGKSTVAVNLALALKGLGFSVGLLDIDIYGPSVPTLLGINERPNVHNRRIVPVEKAGLKLMSLGFLMDDDTPVIWRGPIVTGIIRQFLQDVDWAGTDYLIVDLPPGTGDAQLSLAQTMPVDAAVVVTTPSELALVDAARGLRMFDTLNIEVLGLVENMSSYVWPGAEAVRGAVDTLKSTGADAGAVAAIERALEAHGEAWIFGRDAGRREAERLGTPFLGSIPLDETVREGGDNGRPIVLDQPNSLVASAFSNLARAVSDAKPLPEGEGTPKRSVFSFTKS